ncbi:MAG TPA: FG-GAP-like repeat-containing protein [Nannocystis sp.]
MNTNLARYWALSGLALLGPALVGCGDNSSTSTAATDATTTGTSTTDGTSTGTTGPTTGEPTDSGMSASETGSTSTTAAPTTSTTDATTGTSGSTTDATTTTGTTGGVDMCMTILCGEPAVCCAEGDECVDGACLPLCESGVRCGPDKSICCDAGEVCLGDACVAPLGPCEDSYDCEPGNYCEPVFDQCLPQPDPLDCEVVPNFGAIEVQTEWAWTEHEVISLPVIADVDGDGTPDVVVNTTKMVANDPLWRAGEIVLLDGKTGQKKWQIPEDPDNNKFGSNGRASIAVGDVNGDGKPDIIYPGRAMGGGALSRVHAVDGTDGSLIWTARNPDNTELQVRIDGASVTVTNFDNDPEAEIAIGALIIDHDGLVVWNEGGIGPRIGSPLNNMNQPYYYGGLATVADLDGDNVPELITGRQAWKVNWVQGNPPMVTLVEFWNNNNNPQPSHNNDGWPAVADLDGDGKPEVIITAYPTIRVLNGQTGQLWCGVDPSDMLCQMNPSLRTQPIPIEGGNLGGPATIADFDGDGRPEAGIAGGKAYAVYDFNRPSFAGDGIPETIVKLPENPDDPAPGAMFPRWKVTTQDDSSAATGSSVFDFQGDGAAEAVYQDECFARVYDGATGQVQLQIMNSSATIHEYPLVADVDGDGNSEFIVVANFADPQNVDLCKTKTPNFTPRKGVFVYGAGGDNWVPTRKVWAQHTYHVTNADSSGNPPLDEQDNWTTPGLNNFRQNVQGEGVFNAPDLTISLAADLNKCSDELVLVATIYNEGTLGVSAGIDVTFYEGVNNMGIKLGTKPTAQNLLPGGSTQVTWTVPGPTKDAKKNFFVEIDPGINNGLVQECNEDNNGALITEAFCPEAG